MFNVTPIKGMMTVIYEFPVDEETTLQNYDIYFTNEELTDDQKALIEWYRDVFRPEDLPGGKRAEGAEVPRLSRRAHYGG